MRPAEIDCKAGARSGEETGGGDVDRLESVMVLDCRSWLSVSTNVISVILSE